MDSGNRNIYGALEDFYQACLLSIIKVRESTMSTVDTLVLVDRLYVENSGKISDVSGLVTLRLGTAKRPITTMKIFVGIV